MYSRTHATDWSLVRDFYPCAEAYSNFWKCKRKQQKGKRREARQFLHFDIRNSWEVEGSDSKQLHIITLFFGKIIWSCFTKYALYIVIHPARFCSVLRICFHIQLSVLCLSFQVNPESSWFHVPAVFLAIFIWKWFVIASFLGVWESNCSKLLSCFCD